MKRYSLSLLAGLTAAAAIFPTTAAHADQLPIAPLCAEQRDTTGTQYAVNLCDVTDVDQFRTHLAAKGNSHCGPASLYNAMFYLGEHKGLPMRITPNGQLLTEYDPAVPADYDPVTAWLGWLGYKAGMGPNGGGSSSSPVACIRTNPRSLASARASSTSRVLPIPAVSIASASRSPVHNGTPSASQTAWLEPKWSGCAWVTTWAPTCRSRSWRRIRRAAAGVPASTRTSSTRHAFMKCGGRPSSCSTPSVSPTTWRIIYVE